MCKIRQTFQLFFYGFVIFLLLTGCSYETSKKNTSSINPSSKTNVEIQTTIDTTNVNNPTTPKTPIRSNNAAEVKLYLKEGETQKSNNALSNTTDILKTPTLNEVKLDESKPIQFKFSPPDSLKIKSVFYVDNSNMLIYCQKETNDEFQLCRFYLYDLKTQKSKQLFENNSYYLGFGDKSRISKTLDNGDICFWLGDINVNLMVIFRKSTLSFDQQVKIPENIIQPDISFDGKKLVYGLAGNDLREGIKSLCYSDVNFSNQKVMVNSVSESENVRIPIQPSWSPDGKKVLFTIQKYEGYGGFGVIDLETNKLVFMNEDSVEGYYWVNNSQICYGYNAAFEGEVSFAGIVDIGTGEYKTYEDFDGFDADTKSLDSLNVISFSSHLHSELGNKYLIMDYLSKSKFMLNNITDIIIFKEQFIYQSNNNWFVKTRIK